MTTTTTTNSKPAAVLRDGAIKATVWQNAGEKGVYFSVRVTRTWKDEQGVYHDTDRFSGTELLRLGHLVTKAYEKVAELRLAAGATDDQTE